MPRYVDGFLIPVPKNKLQDYLKMARMGGKMWMRHGALDYKECVVDDMKPKYVTYTFGKAANAKKGETVIFSYIVFKSRAHRDAVNAKVMKDPMMQPPKDKKGKEMAMPFDMKRMAYGGFKAVVDMK